ncbi:aldehyde dehydrogenase [Streptomyces sp. SPB78]|nr:aldehyde dehydrogenase [Streptomyces sp. SPB78]
MCEAMVHGGPWPATSAPWSTSVGTAAVDRFTRPVALQGVPRGLLGGFAG